jgi:hypothetical protein
MRIFFLLAMLLVAMPALAESNNIPAEWKECKTDEDCTQINYGCCGWISINKEHEQDGATYAARVSGGTSPGACSTAICINPPPARTACVDGTCKGLREEKK